MKIQTKLTGFFVIQLAVFSYLLVWLSTLSYKQETHRLNQSVAKERIQNMLAMLDNHAAYAGQGEANEKQAREQALALIRSRYHEAMNSFPVIIDSRGRMLAHPRYEDAWLTRTHSEIQSMFQKNSGELRVIDNNAERIIYYEHFKPWNWLVGYSIPSRGSFLRGLIFDTNYRLVLVVLCGVGITAGCLFLLLQKALSPLNGLVDSASEMAAGRFPMLDEKKNYSKDEIGILARSFDEMSWKIKESMSNLQSEIQVRRKREQEISELIENSPLPILIIRPDRTFTTNWMFKEFFGWSHDELGDIHKWFEMNVPVENYQGQQGTILRQMLGAQHPESQVILPIRCRDGRRVDVDIHQKIIGYNNVLMINDLTERKSAERKFRQTWSYLNLLFNSIRLLIIAVNEKGMVTQWNQATARYTGIPEKQAVGSKLWSIAPFMKPFKADIESALASDAMRELYRQTIDLSGEKYFNISITSLENSETPGAVIILEDVTELIHKGEELIQAQKMETVGTLTGGLAHDFNNVLAGIKGSLSMINYIIANSPDKVDEIKEYVELSERSVLRAANMVEQLLTLSRKSKLHVKPVNLRNAIENVLSICRATFDKSVVIKTHYAAVSTIVEADQTQIEQVLLNLMINAEHAMTIMRGPDEPHGGVIEVRISRIIPDNSNPLAQRGDDKYYWAISIRDRGVGIPHDIQMKVFDPFFTTKTKGKGSGLGLAMVYNIIHQHQGFVELKSEPGKGTEFIIYLPEFFEHSGVTEVELPAQNIIHGSGTILVIDDDEAIRTTATGMLSKLGYKYLTAGDGNSGLELYYEHYREIDAVILDMVMPGISGKEVYLRLREFNPEAKILLSSGFYNDQRVTDVIGMGVNGFLKKPYSLSALSTSLNRVLKNG